MGTPNYRPRGFKLKDLIDTVAEGTHQTEKQPMELNEPYISHNHYLAPYFNLTPLMIHVFQTVWDKEGCEPDNSIHPKIKFESSRPPH